LVLSTVSLASPAHKILTVIAGHGGEALLYAATSPTMSGPSPWLFDQPSISDSECLYKHAHIE